MNAILGIKVGMTQTFDTKGVVTPVTVVSTQPMVVVQKKTVERDGYEAVQCAFDDCKKVSNPIKGHLSKASVGPKRVLKEFKFDNHGDLQVGSVIACDIFKDGDWVDVSGKTRGRGFSGSIVRWNHHRLKMTHGTGPTHRSVGSTGSNSTPSKVIKGLQMPGQYGHENVTIQNLRVVKVDKERNFVLISGAVPGPKGGTVMISKAVKN
ncbi:MAG: 50S ribosomal protein L3 [Firmicutes bacterium]|nr:50S ribosomal protein L3 [Bacillota bacterium]